MKEMNTTTHSRVRPFSLYAWYTDPAHLPQIALIGLCIVTTIGLLLWGPPLIRSLRELRRVTQAQDWARTARTRSAHSTRDDTRHQDGESEKVDDGTI